MDIPVLGIVENYSYMQCPHCGEKAEVYSRITGYYRPVQNWNDGKAQEYKDRLTYDVAHSVLTHKGPKIGFGGDAVMMNAAETEEAGAPKAKAILFKTAVCPNCKIAGSMLDEAGVDYSAMDANDAPELVKKYGIMQAPTLVLVDGDNYEKYTGVSDIRGWLLS